MGDWEEFNQKKELSGVKSWFARAEPIRLFRKLNRRHLRKVWIPSGPITHLFHIQEPSMLSAIQMQQQWAKNSKCLLHIMPQQTLHPGKICGPCFRRRSNNNSVILLKKSIQFIYRNRLNTKPEIKHFPAGGKMKTTGRQLNPCK